MHDAMPELARSIGNGARDVHPPYPAPKVSPFPVFSLDTLWDGQATAIPSVLDVGNVLPVTTGRMALAWGLRNMIEDCAHAFCGEYAGVPLGGYGDFAFASPMKFLPLYDGGLYISRNAPPGEERFISKGLIFDLRAIDTILSRSVAYERLGPSRLPLRATLDAAAWLMSFASGKEPRDGSQIQLPNRRPRRGMAFPDISRAGRASSIRSGSTSGCRTCRAF